MIKRSKPHCIAIGNRIREIRAEFGLKQGEFADIFRIHQSTIALLETGNRQMKDIYIKLFNDEFGVNEDWLINGEGPMFDENRKAERAMMKESLLREGRVLTFSKYAEEQGLTPVDQDIIKMFLELDRGVKIKVIGDFSRFFVGKQEISV